MTGAKTFIVLLVVCLGCMCDGQVDSESENIETVLHSLGRIVRGNNEEIETAHQSIFDNFADFAKTLHNMDESIAKSLGGFHDRMTSLEAAATLPWTSEAAATLPSTSEAAATLPWTSEAMLPSTNTTDDPCQEPFHDVNGIGCIYTFARHNDWDTGRNNCKSLGSDLFVAQDPDHFARLSTYIKEFNFEDFWLGVIGRHWLDGRPVADEEWDKDLPNKYAEACGGSGDFAHFHVWDWNCTWKGHSLCQKLPLKL